ncbi:hypothetical protein KAR50_00660 [Periweissella fabaria]|uniref:Uncharacterized protein n=1 Tax=Periweissella fabaria TaxID=546157 RepID=A0ABN8BIJ5_9LACO|nr:hypothetical protein [Periweissella fabaria]MCM0596372.1 hypothetical protein [Periweissella fabaria]CAH0417557.1 hypothetical protein WFA24289_01899 [Periweissella fabaria]
MKKYFKIVLAFTILISIGFAAIPTSVAARGSSAHFGGFHSTRTAPSYGTTTSTPRFRFNRPDRTYNDPHEKSGFGHDFKRGIVQGAGWAVGSNIVNSVWHSMFGFGSNRYVDNNGQTQYREGGYFGWFLLIIIGLIIYFIIRRNRRRY